MPRTHTAIHGPGTAALALLALLAAHPAGAQQGPPAATPARPLPAAADTLPVDTVAMVEITAVDPATPLDSPAAAAPAGSTDSAGSANPASAVDSAASPMDSAVAPDSAMPLDSAVPMDSATADGSAAAQRARAFGGLVPVGGPAADRRRTAQLLGRASTSGELLRSPSTLTPRLAGDAAVQVLAPEVLAVWNSALPWSMNDGAMWAGRGGNLAVTAGVRAAWGRVALTVAPQAVYQQNRWFDVIPYPTRARDRFAFPWPSHPRTDPYSIDLPSRFGDDAFWTVGPGQSTLAVDAGALQAGASTEEQWWGPGVRNALVLSNHAPGVPHLFLRTARPLRTPLGTLEGRWIAGALTESAYFDTVAGRGTRSLGAVALVLRPAFDPGLSLGAARAVYRPVDGYGGAAARLFDPWIARVGHPNERDPFDTTTVRGPDQVFSVFGRWAFPDAGLEVYAEWARRDLPTSLKDALVYPHHGQGYTVGGQWARPAGDAAALRIQAEATYVEQSATIRQREVAPWYLSRRVAQGYTHRGQVLGAAIGPGSSSQWLAADWFAPRWQAGLFGGRVRWHDDFHPNARQHPSTPSPLVPTFRGHDVSTFAGVRGAMRLGGMEVWAEYTAAVRYNLNFQYRSPNFEEIEAVDVRNHTLRLGFSPAGAPW